MFYKLSYQNIFDCPEQNDVKNNLRNDALTEKQQQTNKQTIFSSNIKFGKHVWFLPLCVLQMHASWCVKMVAFFIATPAPVTVLDTGLEICVVCCFCN